MSALALLQFPGGPLISGQAASWKTWKSWEELPPGNIFIQASGESDFLAIPAGSSGNGDFSFPVLPKHIQSSSREEYLQNVLASQEAFSDGRLQKTVISRILLHELPSGFSLLKSFARLQSRYPQALKSLLYQEDEFCWIGASPELLLRIENNTLQTLSLAGTRSPLHPELGEKEQTEQEIVTRHVHSVLDQAGLHDIRQEQSTLAFGPLSHIATRITAGLSGQSTGALLRKLHPTPAIMGAPQQEALHFVKSREKHQRGFYTGLIGYKQSASDAHIYVNLRCASIYKDHLLCFGGAGITAASDPAQEWEESGTKINSILELLLQE